MYKINCAICPDFKLRMEEMLHILKSKSTLNKQMNAQPKYEIKALIIQALYD